jgi:hypothetical protein
MTSLRRSHQSSIAEQVMSPHVADINRFSFDAVHRVLGGVFEHGLHTKRVESLCNATIGVLHSASLAVCAIGQGLAAAGGLAIKHATKQVDRLLSNDGIKVDDILALWVPYVLDFTARLDHKPTIETFKLKVEGLGLQVTAPQQVYVDRAAAE